MPEATAPRRGSSPGEGKGGRILSRRPPAPLEIPDEGIAYEFPYPEGMEALGRGRPLRRRKPVPGNVKLVAALVFCFLAAVPGLLLSRPRSDRWYRRLEKPPFNPPAWAFPAAWTVLYAMMGFSLREVWKEGWENPYFRKDKRRVGRALAPFLAQWFLNALWSPVFFRLRAPLAALFNLSALWITIIATIRRFSPVSGKAGLLLVPYFLWTSFAWALNFEIVRRNRRE